MRMDYLIKSLLDAASIEAGRFSIVRAPCAAVQILTSTMEVFESLAAQRSIRLAKRIEGTDVTVSGDRERIIQVLSNLVSNAVKFTPEGGEIEVGVVGAAPLVRFEVRDTGP